MSIFDEYGIELDETALDLSCGYIVEGERLKAGAAPVDDTVKFVYEDDDFEHFREFRYYTEQDRAQRRIAALKARLAETDYVAVKLMEGTATREEYADLIAQRQAWRDEINELEAAE